MPSGSAASPTAQKAQYTLIKEYTSNYSGLNLMNHKIKAPIINLWFKLYSLIKGVWGSLGGLPANRSRSPGEPSSKQSQSSEPDLNS